VASGAEYRRSLKDIREVGSRRHDRSKPRVQQEGTHQLSFRAPSPGTCAGGPCGLPFTRGPSELGRCHMPFRLRDVLATASADPDPRDSCRSVRRSGSAGSHPSTLSAVCERPGDALRITRILSELGYLGWHPIGPSMAPRRSGPMSYPFPPRSAVSDRRAFAKLYTMLAPVNLLASWTVNSV
jgi:hypothetical protein